MKYYLILCLLLIDQSCLNAMNVLSSSNMDKNITSLADKKFVPKASGSIVAMVGIPIAIGVVGSIIGKVSGGINIYKSYQGPINANECEIIFGWRRASSHASSYFFEPNLHFNFKTKLEENWNYEKMNWQWNEGVERSKEELDGGPLQSIHIHSHEYVCIKEIHLRCGSHTNLKSIESTIVIDGSVIKKASRDVSSTTAASRDEKDCIWFSSYKSDTFWNRILFSGRDKKHGYVYTIDIDAKAFTECAPDSDQECLIKYITVA